MARIDFNQHPAAFMAQLGNSYEVPEDEYKCPGVSHILFGILTAFVVAVWSSEVEVLLSQAVSWIQANWVWILTTSISGLIGSMTTLWVSSLVDHYDEDWFVPKHRVRQGPGALKQWHRSVKKFQGRTRVPYCGHAVSYTHLTLPTTSRV